MFPHKNKYEVSSVKKSIINFFNKISYVLTSACIHRQDICYVSHVGVHECICMGPHWMSPQVVPHPSSTKSLFNQSPSNLSNMYVPLNPNIDLVTISIK